MFWLWIREAKSIWYGVAGAVILVLFGLLLTQIEMPAAGRVYAIYGGIYIAASLLWLYVVEGVTPDVWDILGAVCCLIGVCIMYFKHR